MARKPRVLPPPSEQQIEKFFGQIGKESTTVLSRQRAKLNIQGDEIHDGKTIARASVEWLAAAIGKQRLDSRKNTEWNWLIELSWWPKALSVATPQDISSLELLSIFHDAEECAAKFRKSLHARFPSQADEAWAQGFAAVIAELPLITQFISDKAGSYMLQRPLSLEARAQCLGSLFDGVAPHYQSIRILENLNGVLEQAAINDPGWKSPRLTRLLVALSCASCTQSVDLSESGQQREQRRLREQLLGLAQAGAHFYLEEVLAPESSFTEERLEEKSVFIEAFKAQVQANDLSQGSPESTSRSSRPRL